MKNRAAEPPEERLDGMDHECLVRMDTIHDEGVRLTLKLNSLLRRERE